MHADATQLWKPALALASPVPLSASTLHAAVPSPAPSAECAQCCGIPEKRGANDFILPWVQGLPLNQYGKEKGGNAEITPLQVDPSVTFDTVGGLDHYIRVSRQGLESLKIALLV